MIADKDMQAALDRIARTADGELFYRWLQKRLTAVLQTNDGGALQKDNGERNLAQTLMGLMARGMQETNGHRTDASVIFSVAERQHVRNPAGGRRGLAGVAGLRSEFDDRSDTDGAA